MALPTVISSARNLIVCCDGTNNDFGTPRSRLPPRRSPEAARSHRENGRQPPSPLTEGTAAIDASGRPARPITRAGMRRGLSLPKRHARAAGCRFMVARACWVPFHRRAGAKEPFPRRKSLSYSNARFANVRQCKPLRSLPGETLYRLLAYHFLLMARAQVDGG